MDIGFIHPRAPGVDGSGAVQSATRLVRELGVRGHQVDVFCTRNFSEGEESDGVSLIDFSIPEQFPHHYYTELNHSLSRRAEEFADYDIVHSYMMRSFSGLAQIAETANVATVGTLNAYGGVCPKNDLLYQGQHTCRENGRLRCLECVYSDMKELPTPENAFPGYQLARVGYRTLKAYRNFPLVKQATKHASSIDRFHALAPHIQEIYNEFEWPTESIDIIPNMIDEDFFIEHKSNFTPPYSLLYVGGLKKHKGVQKLIPALSSLLKKNIDVELTIVGDGEEYEELKNQMYDEDVNNVVELKGRVDYCDLPRVYSTHDIFLYPGKWDEPFGRVFLEALGTGLPIVASNVGSIKNIVGEGGEIVSNDIDSLVSGVIAIIEDISNYSEAGKKRAERYRADRVVPEFEVLYKQAIESSETM